MTAEKIQVVPIVIDEFSIYKLVAPDGGYRLRSGGDLLSSDHVLVAIRAAGLDHRAVAELLAEYLAVPQTTDG